MENSFIKKSRNNLSWKALLFKLVVVLPTSSFQLLTSNFLQAQNQLAPYLKLAEQHNPRLKSLSNEYLAALEEIPQVGTLPDPQLSVASGMLVSTGEMPTGTPRTRLSVSQMFPWFGTLTAQERVAAQRAHAKLQQREDAKLALFKQVKVTYNDLYYLQAATRITRESLGLLASFKELARVNFEGARAGFSDVLRVEIEEEALRSKLRYLEDSQVPLVAQFEQLLNTDLGEPITLPDSLRTEELLLPPDSIIQRMLTDNPQLKAWQHEVWAYEEQATVARKMGLPSFTLGGSYVNVVPGVGMEMVEVGMSLPLYRKKYQAMQKQAQLQQASARLREESTEDQLLTELRTRYRDYQDAQRRVKLNRRLADLAERTLDLLQTEFTTGEADFEKIIRIEQQRLTYQLNAEQARVDQNNYVYEVHYLMGIGTAP